MQGNHLHRFQQTLASKGFEALHCSSTHQLQSCTKPSLRLLYLLAPALLHTGLSQSYTLAFNYVHQAPAEHRHKSPDKHVGIRLLTNGPITCLGQISFQLS